VLTVLAHLWVAALVASTLLLVLVIAAQKAAEVVRLLTDRLRTGPAAGPPPVPVRLPAPGQPRPLRAPAASAGALFRADLAGAASTGP